MLEDWLQGSYDLTSSDAHRRQVIPREQQGDPTEPDPGPDSRPDPDLTGTRTQTGGGGV